MFEGLTAEPVSFIHARNTLSLVGNHLEELEFQMNGGNNPAANMAYNPFGFCLLRHCVVTLVAHSLGIADWGSDKPTGSYT